MLLNKKLKILMVGVGEETQGGMWAVAQGYLNSREYALFADVSYVATSTSVTSSKTQKAVRAISGLESIRKKLASREFDLVHVHMAERGSFFRKALVMLLAEHFNVPVVLHMHGGEFDDFFRQASERLRHFVRTALRKADRVIVLGKRFEELYASIGVDPSKIVVIPNAVDVPSQNPYDVESKDVTFLGLVSNSKGLPEYFDAIERCAPLLDTRTHFKLFGPIGDFDPNHEIEKRAIGKIVSYGGFLDAEGKDEQLRRSCVLVLPSRFEVFPLCVIEAMAYGVPVVVTDVGSINEAVTNGVSGMLVSPQDVDELASALMAILGDSARRSKMSEAAYATAVDRYSMASHVSNVERVYREVLRERVSV